MIQAKIVLEYEKRMHAWCALTGSKNGRSSTEQAQIPCPQNLTPTRATIASKPSSALMNGKPSETKMRPTQQHAGVGSRDLSTIQHQLNSVMLPQKYTMDFDK